METITFDRTDEAGFRVQVPLDIDGWRVLEIRGFQPGERPGLYATAWALLVSPLYGNFAVVRIIAQDDSRLHVGEIHWVWDCSTYDIQTRKRANEILNERVKRYERC